MLADCFIPLLIWSFQAFVSTFRTLSRIVAINLFFWGPEFAMKNRKTFSPTSLTFYAFLDVTFFFKEFFLDPIQLFKSVMIYDPYNLILMLLVFVASTRFSRNSLRYPSTADNILLVMSTCQNYKIKGFRQNFMNHFYIFTADRRVAIKKSWTRT